MSDRTDTGQSDSITGPVFFHNIANVESFAIDLQICSHPASQKYHRPFDIDCDH